MLVLSRHRDESIVIDLSNVPLEEIIRLHSEGELKITTTIVDIRGDKCRLGVDAPRELPVHRQEVYEAIQRERPKLTPSLRELIAKAS